MFCSQCGAENPEGAKFCSKCGARLSVAATPTEGAATPEAESSTGLSANVAGLLCYVAGWITGIVFIVLEKKSIFVKFHAWQSIMTFGVLSVVQIILSSIGAATFIFSPGWWFVHVLGIIVWAITGILWIILIIQAGSGKMWKLPWAGDWAEKQISK
jgi:uncharacterized membrane protein/ribosomal protein L40E